jgi:5-(carboxyamino)imidazole ribonucleotide synthase
MARPLVGVLGGGQLGRMLGLAGVPLGLAFRFLDPTPEAPGGVVGALHVAALDDEAAAAAVADGCEVVTYEWEGVPVATARAAAARAPVRPGLEPLGVAQDRLAEKTTLSHLDVAVTPFAPVDDAAALPAALERVGLPAVLKTRRGGYDGKGQRVLRSADDAAGAWEALGSVPLILEALVSFERELSLVAVRGLDGATACYPLVETEHEHGILRVVRAPAPRITAARQADAETIARRLLDKLEYVGVLTVELFERDGDLLANELAPRVHNSGHWTIEGADTSQFENHLRAVLGWPLGSTAARGHSAMVNALGELPDRAAVLRVPAAHLHDYGKTPRPGRKVGHVTVTADSASTRDDRLTALRSLVEGWA